MSKCRKCGECCKRMRSLKKTKSITCRDTRLNNNIKQLYHQTSAENAEKIIKENRFKLGKFGIASGGIYFADKPENTYHKSRNKGAILECDVKLGNIQELNFSNNQLSFDILLDKGIDSVLIHRRGDEYVVYNTDQIINIRLYSKKLK